MKLKELFYFMGLKPSVKFFGAYKECVGEFEGEFVHFYQWKTPKSVDVKLNRDEIDELKIFLKKGDVAIDIGAHIGDSTLPIALACGAEGCVYAFEPNPVVFSVLAKNCWVNRGLTNIKALPFACTQVELSTKFGYSDSWLANGGDKTSFTFTHGHAFKVPINGLHPLGLIQSLHLHRLKYIKVDVEGLDYEILKLFENLIDSRMPYIKFEIAKFTSIEMRKKLENFFKDRKYEVRIVGSEGRLFGKYAVSEDFYRDYSLDMFCVPML